MGTAPYPKSSLSPSNLLTFLSLPLLSGSTCARAPRSFRGVWRVVWLVPLVVGACSRRGGDAAPVGSAAAGSASAASVLHGPGASEQAVLVEVHLAPGELGELHALEGRLHAAIAAAGVGELDGDELAAGGREGTLYAYGADADRLYAVMRPLLEGAPCMRGAVVTLRYGILARRHARDALLPGSRRRTALSRAAPSLGGPSIRVRSHLLSLITPRLSVRSHLLSLIPPRLGVRNPGMSLITARLSVSSHLLSLITPRLGVRNPGMSLITARLSVSSHLLSLITPRLSEMNTGMSLITARLSVSSHLLSLITPRLSVMNTGMSLITARLSVSSHLLSLITPRLSEMNPGMSLITARLSVSSHLLSLITPRLSEMNPGMSLNTARLGVSRPRLPLRSAYIKVIFARLPLCTRGRSGLHCLHGSGSRRARPGAGPGLHVGRRIPGGARRFAQGHGRVAGQRGRESRGEDAARASRASRPGAISTSPTC